MLESLKKGRLDDGNRSIAEKIINRLSDLEKTIEKNRGRWAWELLQNAKDSVADDDDKKVAIKIEYNANSLKFSHNGIHFTELDVRGIINQISSKEVAEEEQTRKTGRFGTGFLTTHLLSRKITIEGILKASDDDKYYPFEFLLDRTANKPTEFMAKLAETWTNFETPKSVLDSYDSTNFNTSFSYALEIDKQREVANIGLQEFIKLLPLVLTFITKIESVEIIDNTINKKIRFEKSTEPPQNGITLIRKLENNTPNDISILTKSNGKVTLAALLEKTEKGYIVQSIEDLPKLFCDFPLVGTEKFHFPFIVNSFFFNPLRERDGLWLKDNSHKEVQENRTLIEETLPLIKELIADLEQGSFLNLYNTAETRTPNVNSEVFDSKWFDEKIQTPLRKLIINANIVELENSTERKAIKDLWFPPKEYLKSVKTNIWKYLFDLHPEYVCKKDHLHFWIDLSWGDWHIEKYETLLDDIANFEKIAKLSLQLEMSEADTFDWLNEVCMFVLENESNIGMFSKKAVVPNQKCIFRKKDDLRIDQIKDEDLVTILATLGDDWENILIHQNVGFGKYIPKEKKEIATEITRVLLKRVIKDNDYRTAIVLLMEWFDHNSPDEAKTLFAELYRTKADIFMNTMADKDSLYKIMRSNLDLSEVVKITEIVSANPTIIDDTTKIVILNSLLTEFGLSDIEDLRKRLQITGTITESRQKQDITEEFLAGAGIATLEELEAALEDKNLSTFVHSSTPDFDLLKYVKGIIERAKENIIKHLKTLPNYDCSSMEELTPNTLGGITRDGSPIIIVIRPSDNGFVIVYSKSEKDYLDFEDANTELWIDNGIDTPKHLRLGKILKNLGINKVIV
jgi:hypothetical protein